MLKDFMAKVGIGSASVDTIIKNDVIYPDTMIDLEIRIEGGSVDQDLNGLSLALMTSAKEEVELGDEEMDMTRTVVLEHRLLELEDSIIKANETRVLECELYIPPETPITEIESYSEVWIKTGLDIENGVDSGDKDYVTISLPDVQRNVLVALENLGYDLKKVDTEVGTARGEEFESQIECYQEFEFRKNRGFFNTQEIEITFVQSEEDVGVLLEIDRTFGGDTYISDLLPLDADYDGIYGWLEGMLS